LLKSYKKQDDILEESQQQISKKECEDKAKMLYLTNIINDKNRLIRVLNINLTEAYNELNNISESQN